MRANTDAAAEAVHAIGYGRKAMVGAADPIAFRRGMLEKSPRAIARATTSSRQARRRTRSG